MALKQLRLGRDISLANKRLEDLIASESAFLDRRTALQLRESELEAAIAEITDESTQEDRDAVDAAIAEHDTNKATLEADEAAHEKKKTDLQAEIQTLTDELASLENRETTPPPAGAPAAPAAQVEERMNIHMAKTNRTMFFSGISIATRDEIMARDEVKQFLQRLRTFGGEKRAISGTELLIPDILVGLLREQLENYSKLAKHVFNRKIPGTSRLTITGAMPEGIWTEMCAKINELSLSFNQITVDGYKVGGFIPICNAVLQDSDISLANEIMTALGYAIGYALDKAVVFGTGTKMPVGISTRLAQEEQPSYWESTAPTWTDLHATHITKFNPAAMDDITFFRNVMACCNIANSPYATGGKFWAMNQLTYQTLISRCLQFNASGTLVAMMNNTLPVIGGTIEILEFIDDYDIVGGYGSLYLLAERAGQQLAASEHVRFLEDQTVFKGTARYDGKPIFGEGFVHFNVNHEDPTVIASFDADVANTVGTPYSLPVAGTYTGAITVGLYCATPNTKIYYTLDESDPDYTDTLATGGIAITSTKTLKAIAYDAVGNASSVYTAVFTILSTAVAKPYAVPVAGTYEDSVSVGLFCTTPDASIYYTNDESEPTAAKTLVTGAILIEATTTIKAIAIKNGVSSEVLTALYTITTGE